MAIWKSKNRGTIIMDSDKLLTIMFVSLVLFFVFLTYQIQTTNRLYIKEGYSQTYSERGIMLWVKK